MLEHEYDLLIERLHASRGSTTRFFAFADTVATHKDLARCHGWMGVKFQRHIDGSANEVILHVRLLDRFRLQQQEALGVLGVNLISACFYKTNSADEFLTALTDQLHSQRIEIDMICARGPDLTHFDNRVLSLELVRRGLTEAVLFGPDGQMLQPSDALFKKQVLVQRGTFRPVTLTNLEILEKGLQQMQKDHPHAKTQVLFEITMQNLGADGHVEIDDFLQRVDTLSALGHCVLISNFFLYYSLKVFLRRHTDQAIGLVMGASHLEKLFDEIYYKDLTGGLIEAFAYLFDRQTKTYVFPFKSEQICITSKTFHPQKNLRYLYEHFKENKFIVDIAGCDDVDTSLHSQDVREMLAKKQQGWEQLVPSVVSDKIKKLQLFGYRP
jgi:hypothetical protein